MIIQQIKEHLEQATAIIITAGAGMGVDSGLPDFRGKEGFWNAHKPFTGKYNLTDCANPRFLETNPNLFWGFYGNRLNMYRNTVPHQGFNLLQSICKNRDHFVITSNVDGQFQKAGFKDVYEIHGSIHTLQCTNCEKLIDSSVIPYVNVDLQTFAAQEPLPKCDSCHRLLRPNILMFNDGEWISDKYDQQESKYQHFIQQHRNDTVVIIELGAGKVLPSIRNLSEHMVNRMKQSILIRINPQDDDVPKDNNRCIPLRMNALNGVQYLADMIINQQQ